MERHFVKRGRFTIPRVDYGWSPEYVIPTIRFKTPWGPKDCNTIRTFYGYLETLNKVEMAVATHRLEVLSDFFAEASKLFVCSEGAACNEISHNQLNSLGIILDIPYTYEVLEDRYVDKEKHKLLVLDRQRWITEIHHNFDENTDYLYSSRRVGACIVDKDYIFKEVEDA